MPWKELKSATTLTVKSELRDDSSEDDLRKWVVAIAFGKIVYVDRGIEGQPVVRWKLTAARGCAHVDVRFTQRFAGRHSELAKITTTVSKSAGLNWCVTDGTSLSEASSRDAQEINSQARFVTWLRAKRVIARN